MIVVDRSALVEYPAHMMYSLVEDIEAYPKFLPWCAGADIVLREPGRTVATLHVLYHGIRQNFTTDNLNVPGEKIEVRLVSGPFMHLQGNWAFRALGDAASKVSLKLEYQLKSGLLERAAGPVFNHIASTFMEAFVKRADQIARSTAK